MKQKIDIKNKEDILKAVLDSITPSVDEWMERRIHHINFARIVFWMCVNSRSQEFFYPKDLRQFIKLDHSRVFYILKEFSEQGILRKKYLHNNLLSYFFVKEADVPKILKYFEKAKKTLGIKIKREEKLILEKKEEDNYYM